LKLLDLDEVVVLGLPRGGVPVAAEVAKALRAPLDVCLVRKLGVPFRPELGMGAIGEDGVRVINDEVVRGARITEEELAQAEDRERQTLKDRARRYRGDREPLTLEGRTVVVVDDGVATGATARAACRIARARGAAQIVLAVPVAPVDLRERLGGDADEQICLDTPLTFASVGEFYADFSQTDDREVVHCLEHAAGNPDGTTRGTVLPGRDVEVPAGGSGLRGRLVIPGGVAGIVVFAHGSGSSRHSPRNRFVAAGLNRAGLGTLLFDLLTDAEEGDRANVFDTGLLAGRLVGVTDWLSGVPEAEGLPVGYFGASTGAAAALSAAAELGTRIAAVVSRGGRPDLAGAALSVVTSPTLLIVGGDDPLVLDLNRRAQAQLRCENRLSVVPRATHLFEEPGTLEVVTDLAGEWFVGHMAAAASQMDRH
jgi:putative phosphoribosyl transferase